MFEVGELVTSDEHPEYGVGTVVAVHEGEPRCADGCCGSESWYIVAFGTGANQTTDEGFSSDFTLADSEAIRALERENAQDAAIEEQQTVLEADYHHR